MDFIVVIMSEHVCVSTRHTVHFKVLQFHLSNIPP